MDVTLSSIHIHVRSAAADDGNTSIEDVDGAAKDGDKDYLDFW